MTEPLFFDTDCLSAFLWTDQGSIVTRLYPGRVVVPQSVLDELSRVTAPAFKERVAALTASTDVEVRDIDLSSPAFPLYRQMTSRPKPGFKVVGRGEAAAMALAVVHQGVVASNNFRDTAAYIRAFNLKYKTTGSILVEAYENGLVSEAEANAIWADMLSEGRWIGARSFTEFLAKPIDPLAGL
ncbi:hypothetical protein [Arabiibacter massiliensis]|uniref:hypothetical protein n=1 Tax=Arabiibacter massiliensis TaxID=1870985 RepID=UPI0009B9F2E4|nr:hypothetical protein [Arabiibacter massiliensis]